MADNQPDSSRKIELVGKLVTQVDRLAASFSKIEASSAKVADNLQKSLSAVGGQTSGGFSPSAGGARSPWAGLSDTITNLFNGGEGAGQGGGTKTTEANFSPSAGKASTVTAGFTPTVSATPAAGLGIGVDPLSLFINGFRAQQNFLKNLLQGGGKFIQGAVGFAAPDVDTSFYIENILKRQNFFSDQPLNNKDLENEFRTYAGGLPTSAIDPIKAANMALGAGFMPGSQGYKPFMQGATTISALVPGAGVEGGVQAMGALNQARNVNMLRMIGINVRDINTNMTHGIDSVVNQLWSVLSTAAGGSPSKKDLADSLLPGNALDSILNQYFADPILRASVVSALYQKAGGVDVSYQNINKIKESSVGKGTLSEAEFTRRQESAYLRLYDTVSAGGQLGNRLGGVLLQTFSSMLDKPIIRDVLKVFSALEAFTGLAGGSGGLLLSGAGQVAGAPFNLSKDALGAILNSLKIIPTSNTGGAPNIVNISMNNGTYTDARQAGMAVADRLKRTTTNVRSNATSGGYSA